MLHVFVIGKSATERSSLVRKLEALVATGADELEVLPHISFRPTSMSEVPYLEQADIVLVASSVAEEDLTAVRDLKGKIGDTPLLVFLSPRLDRLSIIEQLARFGVADTLPETIEHKELLRKLVLYGSVKRSKSSGGKLIVVQGAKGGVGTTTVAAALGDALLREGKKVCVIDFDLTRQGLARFLQVKPFVNETLAALLLGGRRIDTQMLDQLTTPLWEEDEDIALHVVAPAPDADEFHADSTRAARSLQSLLSTLSERFDAVVVDTGCIRGALRRVLLSGADSLVTVTSNDPGSLMALIQMLSKDLQQLPDSAALCCVENRLQPAGLPAKVVSEEVRDFLAKDGVECEFESIEYSKNGARWPGSGESFYALAAQRDRSALSAVATRCLGAEYATTRRGTALLGALFSRRQKSKQVQLSTDPNKLQIEFKPTGETLSEKEQGAELRFSAPVFSK